VLRPDIVLFTEPLPGEALASAELAVKTCDMLLVIGTSGVVYPAAALPAKAHSRGALVVEINPADTALTEQMDGVIRASSAEALPWVVKELVGGG